MNDKSKRLARTLGAILTAARWLIIASLAVLVPTLIAGIASPGIVPMSVIGDGGARFDPGAPFPTALVVVYALVNLALVLVIVTKLRHMMRSVVAGTPFAADNALRLRWIAAAMAGLALLPIVARPLIPLVVRPAIDMADPNFNFGLWLGALTVLVLAEVFREGARLREDADMTV